MSVTQHRVSSFTAIAACLALGSGACAPSSPADDPADGDPRLVRADSIVRDWVSTGRIPGAVLLVSEPNRTAFLRAYGSAQTHGYGSGQYPDSATSGGAGIEPLEGPVPMTTGTVFDLASVTKVMATTYAVMLLVDRGSIRLDAPLGSYIGEFQGDGREDITIEQLLTHRSGLPQWVPVSYHASGPEEALGYIGGLPLSWEIGAERHYSDLGFMLLGLVVERVTGGPLDDFVRDELYEPLGLAHTRFGRPSIRGGVVGEGDVAGAEGTTAAVTATDVAGAPVAATSHGNPFERRMVHDPGFGYDIEGDPDVWDGWRRRTLIGEVNDGNAYHAFGGVAGHAGLFSTAEELGVLLRLLLDGGTVEGRRYVDEGVIERFLTPTGDGQALGWQIPAYAPPGSFAHTGFTGTYVLGVRESGLAVVLLTNRQNGGVDEGTEYPDVGPLQRAVAGAVIEGR